MFYHLFTKSFGQIVRFIYFRAWTQGKRNIPKRGPAIIVSNHLAVIDSFVLPIVVRRKIWFIGKKEYFRTDTFKHRLQKWFFTNVSVYPVDRDGGKAAEDALNVGRACLDSGHLFGLYPEGTRSPDGRLYKGRTGVARLALEKHVPVIPVAMISTRKAQPPNQAFPKPYRVGVKFGKPVEIADLYEKYDVAISSDNTSEIRSVLRETTDRIMFALQNLSGQEYVGIYATEAKEIIKTGIDPLEHAKNNNILIIKN